MQWLGRLHGIGFNAALVAGLALMPAVVAVGYWTGYAPNGAARARIASDGLRGTFNGAEEGSRDRIRGVAF